MFDAAVDAVPALAMMPAAKFDAIFAPLPLAVDATLLMALPAFCVALVALPISLEVLSMALLHDLSASSAASTLSLYRWRLRCASSEPRPLMELASSSFCLYSSCALFSSSCASSCCL